eukprot:scaffold146112_cov18-Prasinocladus_malaysianus.AAC.1
MEHRHFEQSLKSQPATPWAAHMAFRYVSPGMTAARNRLRLCLVTAATLRVTSSWYISAYVSPAPIT